MRAADFVVDIGPGAGRGGGEIVAAGSVEEIMAVERSVTGAYLSGRKKSKCQRNADPSYKTIN